MTTTARLVPWDTTAAESAEAALTQIERAIDVLAEAISAESEGNQPLEERLTRWQLAENLLREAFQLVADGRGAIARRLAHKAIGEGRAQCRSCFGYFQPTEMVAQPFLYGTQGEESVRYLCSDCSHRED